ncbi:hypothetical protein [Runella aurantiaca]|uniref:Uncharacterized protein n=1 Tax=Runella aurantiaca TaxID=2282308 RepID=A0A369I1W7_9BACT|nr:hypothetical protein [Runella aurantiaca]RDB03558.1 hypothetical protein DVG78_22895 [Runella aurantiaca]
MDRTINSNVLDVYLGSGKWLMDKDRNINSDLIEIHTFFRPIDRLFGDYETRKKFNLHEALYRCDFDGKEVAITKIDLEKYRELQDDDYTLIFFTIVFTKGEYLIQPYPISIHELLKGNYPLYGQFEANEVKARYVLDPVKLYHIMDLDGARFQYYYNQFWRKNSELRKNTTKTNEEITEFIEAYAQVKNFFKKHKRHFKINRGMQFKLDELYYLDQGAAEYLKNKSDNINNINENIKILKNDNINNAQEIVDALEKEKLKNFERFDQVKIRLGQYEDGRYVIYLHPYESESNCPGRIPAE